MQEQQQPNKLDKTGSTISGMFNEIAPNYDLLNHVLSLNTDTYWRNKLVAYLKGIRPDVSSVLDIACGTGDSTLAIYKAGIEVTGIDIAEKMMEVARAKSLRLKFAKKNGICIPLPEYITGNAEHLPFEKPAFDAVSISFGIRNFNHRNKCLEEIYRVIKPGGHIAVLEFAKPENKMLRTIYNLYFNNVLPFIGGIVSKDRKAYGYLARSVEQFPKFGAFCTELSDAGFTNVQYKSYTFGIAVLYTGDKKM